MWWDQLCCFGQLHAVFPQTDSIVRWWHTTAVVTKGRTVSFTDLSLFQSSGRLSLCYQIKPLKWGDTQVANMQTRPFLLTKLINRRFAWMGLMRAAKKNPRFVMVGILLPACGILVGTRKHKLWANVSRDLHLLKNRNKGRFLQKAQHLIWFVSLKHHFTLSFCDEFYIMNKSNYQDTLLKLCFKHLCIILSLISMSFLRCDQKKFSIWKRATLIYCYHGDSFNVTHKKFSF